LSAHPFPKGARLRGPVLL